MLKHWCAWNYISLISDLHISGTGISCLAGDIWFYLYPFPYWSLVPWILEIVDYMKLFPVSACSCSRWNKNTSGGHSSISYHH
ncbi:hypothetical protein AAHA92_24192 [Salvia divinorum]|uniref:Uncharacterized protein n=1 Tax=Salvia divinorum TaxID=28513 RepID=A0ABD1G6K7_SALDI